MLLDAVSELHVATSPARSMLKLEGHRSYANHVAQIIAAVFFGAGAVGTILGFWGVLVGPCWMSLFAIFGFMTIWLAVVGHLFRWDRKLFGDPWTGLADHFPWLAWLFPWLLLPGVVMIVLAPFVLIAAIYWNVQYPAWDGALTPACPVLAQHNKYFLRNYRYEAIEVSRSTFIWKGATFSSLWCGGVLFGAGFCLFELLSRDMTTSSTVTRNLAKARRILDFHGRPGP